LKNTEGKEEKSICWSGAVGPKGPKTGVGYRQGRGKGHKEEIDLTPNLREWKRETGEERTKRGRGEETP